MTSTVAAYAAGVATVPAVGAAVLAVQIARATTKRWMIRGQRSPVRVTAFTVTHPVAMGKASLRAHGILPERRAPEPPKPVSLADLGLAPRLP